MTFSGRMDPLRKGFVILLLGAMIEAASRSATQNPSVSRSVSYSVSPSVSPSSSLVPIIDPTAESPPIILYISIPLGLFSGILIVAIVIQAMSYRRSIRLLSPNVRLIQSGPPVPPLDLNETIPATAFSITNPMNRVQKDNEEDPVNVAI